jgi:hypothetical protein
MTMVPHAPLAVELRLWRIVFDPDGRPRRHAALLEEAGHLVVAPQLQVGDGVRAKGE